MKKLFAILLAVAMMLCMIPFMAFAATDEVTYIEIDSVDDIYGLDKDGKVVNRLTKTDNYKLIANIVFGDADVELLKQNSLGLYGTEKESVSLATLSTAILPADYAGIFDGNGKSIVYKGVYNGNNTSSGFIVQINLAGTIKNLTVGSADTPLNYTYGKNAGTNVGVIASAGVANAQIVIDNVTIYANMNCTGYPTKNANIAMFIGNLKNSSATITNSVAIGSIDADKMGYVGGVIGRFQPGAADHYLNISGVVLNVEFKTEGYNNNSTFGAGGVIGCINGTDVASKPGATVNVSDVIVLKDVPEFTTNADLTDNKVGYYTMGADCVVKPRTTFTNMEIKAVNAVGASIKIENGALRFRATAGAYAGLKKLYGASNVKVGMVVAEKSVATTLGANFKIDAADTNNMVATEVDANGNFYAISEMTAQNYATEYTALGYIQYSTDGGATWTTVYADAATTRSVSAIATAAVADVADAVSDTHGFAAEGGKFSPYTAEQITKLKTYIVSAS